MSKVILSRKKQKQSVSYDTEATAVGTAPGIMQGFRFSSDIVRTPGYIKFRLCCLIGILAFLGIIAGELIHPLPIEKILFLTIPVFVLSFFGYFGLSLYFSIHMRQAPRRDFIDVLCSGRYFPSLIIDSLSDGQAVIIFYGMAGWLAALRHPETQLPLDLISFGFSRFFAPHQISSVTLPAEYISSLVQGGNKTTPIIVDLLAYAEDVVADKVFWSAKRMLLYSLVFVLLKMLKCVMNYLYDREARKLSYPYLLEDSQILYTFVCSMTDYTVLFLAFFVYFKMSPSIAAPVTFCLFLGLVPCLFALLSFVHFIFALLVIRSTSNKVINKFQIEPINHKRVKKLFRYVFIPDMLADVLMAILYTIACFLQYLTLVSSHKTVVILFPLFVFIHCCIDFMVSPHMSHNYYESYSSEYKDIIPEKIPEDIPPVVPQSEGKTVPKTVPKSEGKTVDDAGFVGPA